MVNQREADKEEGEARPKQEGLEVRAMAEASPFAAREEGSPPPEGEEATLPTPPTPSNDSRVGGRLRQFAGAWVEDRWARSITAHGLRWRWEGRPPPLKELKPQRASPVLVDYVKEMLDKGAIVPFNGRGVQNHLFTRPKKGTDKLRVILNLSHLNRQIPCPTFKMVSVQEVRLSIPQGAWLTCIDLRDAYWHVPIAKSFQKFLAFSLPMPDGQNSFAFQAMPFGLSIAPRIFTKLCAVLVRRLKERGVEVYAYLDDWLVVAESEKESRAATARVVRLLEAVGFILNRDKSHLTPTQSIEWLGWTWSTKDLQISYPLNKVATLTQRVEAFCHQSAISRVQLESLVGTLNWVTTIDPIGRILLKEVTRLQSSLSKKFQRTDKRDRPILFPMPRVLPDLLEYWRLLPQQDIVQRFRPPPHHITIVTDASNSGWGFHTSEGQQGSGTWGIQHRRLHIIVL